MPDKPRFIVGDTEKALRVRVKDQDNAPVNLSTGVSNIHLFARGVDSGDVPETSTGQGVVGVLAPPNNGSDGWVEFQGLGALCDIGTGRAADVYRFFVEVDWTGGGVSRFESFDDGDEFKVYRAGGAA